MVTEEYRAVHAAVNRNADIGEVVQASAAFLRRRAAGSLGIREDYLAALLVKTHYSTGVLTEDEVTELAEGAAADLERMSGFALDVFRRRVDAGLIRFALATGEYIERELYNLQRLASLEGEASLN